ncbi:hypothetical protein [Kiloniella sp. EL199]|uniref:hypothetical protein n=1 Tax=Kiloniella sp. EL199 TaxID=2107581 RepID=UPI000EA04030|nr:hypothetical protein [Kiloniella sp. EL199]
MRVSLLDFRDRLEDCLEARGAQEITLDRASSMIQWAERLHRCGIRFLAKNNDAYSRTDMTRIEEVTEKGNAVFLNANGQSLAVAGIQALEKASVSAKEQGMGLAVISGVCDLVGLGQLVEETVQDGLACFATFMVDPVSEEGQILTELYGNSRGIVGVPGDDEDLYIELYGLPVSHDVFMQGITPSNIGELVVSALTKSDQAKSDKQVSGCTILVLDLPQLYLDMIKGLEAGVSSAPARLFNPADQIARNQDIAEQGYQIEEGDWEMICAQEGLASVSKEGTEA